MADHERFQVFCQVCFKPFEADTVEEVFQAVAEHEVEMAELELAEAMEVLRAFMRDGSAAYRERITKLAAALLSKLEAGGVKGERK